MSLIVESQESVFEAKSSETGELYIEGICMVADVVNKNRRLYPTSVMQKAVDNYNKMYVNEMKALGELNHPPRPNVDPAEASHLITEMKMVGNKVYAKARVLNTPRGQILRGLVEGGWRVQTSSRGLGNLQEKSKGGKKYSEVEDFNITVGFDVVQDQSAPGATMVGVYESVDNEFVLREELKEQHTQNTQNWESFMKNFKEFVSEDAVSLDEATLDVYREVQKLLDMVAKAADKTKALHEKMRKMPKDKVGSKFDEAMQTVYKLHVEIGKAADNASKVGKTIKNYDYTKK